MSAVVSLDAWRQKRPARNDPQKAYACMPHAALNAEYVKAEANFDRATAEVERWRSKMMELARAYLEKTS